MRFILFVLLLFPITLFAQVVNIENRRLGDGTYGFSGAIDMSFAAQKQKDVLMSFNFRPMVQYKFNWREKKQTPDTTAILSNDTTAIDSVEIPKKADYKHLILLINDLTYAGAKGVTYSNFGMTHLRYSYRIGYSNWEWESFTQVQYNKMLLQRVRYILGTGLRVKLMDLKPKEGGYDKLQARLFGGTALFYEYEDIDYTDRPNVHENTLRWSTYLAAYLNFKHFEFSSTTYIQPNLIRFKDVKFSGEYSVLFRVTEPFSIRFSLSHYLDALPPETVTKMTYSLRVGFTYKLDNFKIDAEKQRKLMLKKQAEKQKEKEPVIEMGE
ncbi:MAG TPA: DUF481 domain-containing protein [Crocinitomicaceae bacterium]|nr:DUF481 domain-containing protein [Crocinitomicaceae bacterium]